MQSLHHLLDVSCRVLNSPLSVHGKGSSSSLSVMHGAEMKLELTISLSEDIDGRQRASQTLLTEAGERDLEKVLKLLLQKVVVTPFMMDGSHLLEGGEVMMHSGGFSIDSVKDGVDGRLPFVKGVPYFLEEPWDESVISVSTEGSKEQSQYEGKPTILDRPSIASCHIVKSVRAESGALEAFELSCSVPFSIPASAKKPDGKHPTLVFVLHLLLPSTADEGPSADTYTMMEFLTRQGCSAMESKCRDAFETVSTVAVFGCAYIPVVLHGPLSCHFMTNLSAHRSLSLSFKVENNLPIPIQLGKAVLDPLTTRAATGPFNPGWKVAPLAPNYRVSSFISSPIGKLISSGVMFTPVLSPNQLVLEPGKSYSYEFILALHHSMVPDVNGQDSVSFNSLTKEQVQEALLHSYSTNILLSYSVQGGCNVETIVQSHSVSWCLYAV